jgi:hypothetical protein
MLLLQVRVELLTEYQWTHWLRRCNQVFIDYKRTPDEKRPRYLLPLWEKAFDESKRRGQQLTLFG